MKTITLQEPGKLVMGQTAEPATPGPGEALVRIHRVGVCGTDIHAFAGKQPFFTYPRVLGHELGVEVLALGEGVTADGTGLPLKAGDRGSVEPYINCQQCIACRRGKGNCCANMRVMGVHLDGGMRERLVMPARKLHVATGLSFEQIALVETLAIGAHAVARAGIEKGEKVLVIGAGPIGLAVIQSATGQGGGRVIVMDISESRLTFCRERLGIKDVIDGRESEAVQKIKALTSGDMPTVVFDATGNARSMNGALQFLAPGGRLVYVGLFQGEFSLSDPEFHRRETTLMGSRNALPADFASLITRIRARQIDTAPWITHRVKADEFAATFPEWTRPETGVLKGIVEW